MYLRKIVTLMMRMVQGLVGNNLPLPSPPREQGKKSYINFFSDFLTTETYFKGLPLLHQTYYHVKNSGSHGITIRELSEIMGLTRSFVRSVLKRLILDKQCKWFEEINGRRHTKRLILL